jgi:hypothetical protein
MTAMDNGSHSNMNKLKETGDITFDKFREQLKNFLEL